MLEKNQAQELIKIFEKACDGMDEKGYKDYKFVGMEWDDETDVWEVTFYTEYGNDELVVVRVAPVKNGYRLAGRVYKD
ncbi:hypothetical protein BV372_08165 [Nostoc sp. T09]|uniref:hypothetical protein n=1 Tax=Nostoc sp. T09 TaxID=1932621 RepID=UPI000A3A2386|nr:hypothetical protein [Nostoc sp. T09]OUL36380.1 hypothetical protein BV372_08165 [Nostoc sp. T09]